MALNCKPGQIAWICVPDTENIRTLGLRALHGHVVKTLSLHPDAPPDDPSWIVEPEKSTIVARPFMSGGCIVLAGTVLTLKGVPDSYLRPFKDFPPEEIEQLHRELTA